MFIFPQMLNYVFADSLIQSVLPSRPQSSLSSNGHNSHGVYICQRQIQMRVELPWNRCPPGPCRSGRTTVSQIQSNSEPQMLFTMFHQHGSHKIIPMVSIMKILKMNFNISSMKNLNQYKSFLMPFCVRDSLLGQASLKAFS